MMKRFKNEKYNNLPPIDRVFKAEVDDENEVAKLTIYGDIGDSWFGDSITASDVERELKGITAKTIDVHLNSYGGDVFDGISIYNQLKNHTSEVNVHVDGIAASAGSIIAMSGSKIIMNTGSMMMIHEGSSFAFGTKSDIQKTLNALEGIDESIADIYMTRYSGERTEIDNMIESETWLTSSKAMEVGLADKVEKETVQPEVPAIAGMNEETLKKMFDDFKKEIKNELRSQQNNEPEAEPTNNISKLFLNLK